MQPIDIIYLGNADEFSPLDNLMRYEGYRLNLCSDATEAFTLFLESKYKALIIFSEKDFSFQHTVVFKQMQIPFMGHTFSNLDTKGMINFLNAASG